MKIQSLTLAIILTLFNFYSYANECSAKKVKILLPEEIKHHMNIAEVASANLVNDTIFLSDKRKVTAKDKRKVKTSTSPAYLDAIGKLLVTFSNGEQFRCSANLTDTEINRSSKILTSAEHCFVYRDENGKRNYSIKVSSISWTTKTNSGTIRRDATLLKSDRNTDIAILKLNKAVPFSKVKPLILSTELQEDSPQDLIDLFEESATLAGFSSDTHKGDGGNRQTYTENLTFEDVERDRDESNRRMHKVQAVSYGGASGGALLMSLNEESSEDLYLDGNNGQLLFLGVASSVARQGQSKNKKSLYISEGSYGSPETYVSSYNNFLKPRFLEYFNYNK